MSVPKKLTIALLVIAILTCLSAGTLAIYSQSLDKVAETSMAAKSFVLTASGAQTQGVDIKLAPGDIMGDENHQGQNVPFTVSNFDENSVSEVPIRLTFDMDLLGDLFKKSNGIEVKIVDADHPDAFKYGGNRGEKSWLERFTVNGNGKKQILYWNNYKDGSIVLPAGVPTTRHFVLRFQWLNENDTTGKHTQYNGLTGQVNLTVSGVQDISASGV